MAQKEATEEAQEEQEEALLQVLQALLQALQAKEEAAEVEFPPREAAKKKTSPLWRLWTRKLRLGWGA